MSKVADLCRMCLEKDSNEMHQIFNESLNNKIIMMTGLDVSNIEL